MSFRQEWSNENYAENIVSRWQLLLVEGFYDMYPI